MRAAVVLFWVLQVLLGSVLALPIAIVVIGGSEGFDEFAGWIIGLFAWIAIASLFAHALRRRGRPGAGGLFLLIGLAPFLLLLWLFILFGERWHL